MSATLLPPPEKEREEEPLLEAPPAVKQTLELLEPWIAYVPKKQRRLGSFLAIAMALHVAIFLFLRIDTTRPPALPHLPTAHVIVQTAPPVTPTLAVSTDLSYDFLDQLNDPRLYLFPRENLFGDKVPFALNQLGQLPSTATPTDQPNLAIAQNYEFIPITLDPPEVRVLESLHPTRQGFTYQPSPLHLATETTWVWSANLRELHPQLNATLPSPISNVELTPTVLRVAVGDDGTVRFVVLDKSCSNPELDQQAINVVRRTRFSHPPQLDHPDDSTWGLITIFWHYSTEPTEVVEPTPPSGG